MAEKKDNKNENLRFYEVLRKVPKEAVKTIGAGRLKGMSDVNPMWRIKAMTDTFGPCGIGWKFEITQQWQETYGQEVKAFTNINVYVKVNGEWSEPIPGTGGATLVEINSKGYSYVNDEGFKMSLTDALSVAMKALGVAADIYFSKDAEISQFDTKYEQQAYTQQPAQVAKSAAVVTMPFDTGIQNEISSCANMDALMAIWSKYPQLQTDKSFRDAWAQRRGQIEKK